MHSFISHEGLQCCKLTWLRIMYANLAWATCGFAQKNLQWLAVHI